MDSVVNIYKMQRIITFNMLNKVIKTPVIYICTSCETGLVLTIVDLVVALGILEIQPIWLLYIVQI